MEQRMSNVRTVRPMRVELDAVGTSAARACPEDAYPLEACRGSIKYERGTWHALRSARTGAYRRVPARTGACRRSSRLATRGKGVNAPCSTLPGRVGR